MINIKLLRELEGKATGGPWKSTQWGAAVTSNGKWESPVCKLDKRGIEAPKNAAFIAESRNQLPELLDWVERVRPLLQVITIYKSEQKPFTDDEATEAAKLLGEIE